MNKDTSSDVPWYSQGLRFECVGCGKCCIGDPGNVWVNRAEIEAMAAALDMDPIMFEELHVHTVGRRKSLKERPDGDCILFDSATNRCKLYAVRPRQCRTWPFWQSNIRTPDAWRQTCEDCPGAGHGPLVPLAQIEAHRAVMRI